MLSMPLNGIMDLLVKVKEGGRGCLEGEGFFMLDENEISKVLDRRFDMQ